MSLLICLGDNVISSLCFGESTNAKLCIVDFLSYIYLGDQI